MAKFPTDDERGSLRFIVLLIILSMVTVYAGFKIGNTFMAWQARPAEERGAGDLSMPAEEDRPEEIPDEEIDPEGEQEDRMVAEDEVLEQDTEPADQPAEDAEEEQLEETDLPQDIDEGEKEVDRKADFLVQVGAFGYEENAETRVSELRELNYSAFITGTEPYRVQVAGGDSRARAEDVADSLREDGYEVFIHTQ